MTGSERRVALVGDASFYVGPPLARFLAARGHDLVLGDPGPGFADELRDLGVDVETVDGVRNLSDPESARRLVTAGLARFGRIDAAAAFSGRVITGRFLSSTLDDLHAVVRGCLEAPFHFLQAVLPSMIERGDGQVLVITSAAGARPTPGAPLYSAARAGATMLTTQRRGRGGTPRRAGERGRHELHGLSRVPRARRAPTTPRFVPRSKRRSRCGASARSRSSRRFACRSSMGRVDSPPASSSPTPAGGPEKEHRWPRTFCSIHCNGGCAPCIRSITRRSARWASST